MGLIVGGPTDESDTMTGLQRGPLRSKFWEVVMSTSVLYMSMSIDGYIAGPNDNPENPGGDGFRSITGVVITTRASRSSSRVTVDRIPPPRNIHW
jgi:hypothetical protein